MESKVLPGKPAEMSQEQYTYALAKAAYQTANEAYWKDADPVFKAMQAKTMSEAEGIDQLTNIDKWHKQSEFQSLYIAAEKAMIEWAQDTLRTRSPSAYEKVKVVFEKHLEFPDIHKKLVDLCFHMNATEKEPLR